MVDSFHDSAYIGLVLHIHVALVSEFCRGLVVPHVSVEVTCKGYPKKENVH